MDRKKELDRWCLEYISSFKIYRKYIESRKEIWIELLQIGKQGARLRGHSSLGLLVFLFTHFPFVIIRLNQSFIFNMKISFE